MTQATNLSSQSRYSDAEWQIRVELAACYRAFVHYGWTDTIFTHLSARVPGREDQYIINPYGLMFHEITASNLIKVDFDGKVVDGDYPYNEAGHIIHSAVLQACPDKNVVLHSHTRAGMAVSCMKDGLLPLTQQANEIRNLICYHKYGAVRNGSEECQLLGQDMIGYWIMIMRNHGLLSVGRTVAEAFYYLYTVENACKVQVDVLASGQEIIIPNQDALDFMGEDGMPEVDRPGDYIDRNWQAVTRTLDQKDDSYRQ
jgi:ribulose-5-phosphate 4-epimerase/fuculose-1-phosphate aldolase